MRYLVRAVKYFAAFCVIYLAVVWLSVSTMNGYEQSVWDYVWATLQTTRGQLLVVAVVVLSAFYPRFGFITRRVEWDMEDERDQIIATFALAGFSLREEGDGRMVFRADNMLDRLVMLFEDEITVVQYGQWIDITGIRRGVAKVVYRMGR
ncbi:MAG: hypothetical protein IJ976_03995 [Alistipes sp.]|nr:hypothetical protein [Alistipes sp.]MBQ8437671.1 hypothetical protein [Alistipes sp.]MBQ8553860.1 hypothetical protein [Alistipes sp.]MBR2072810.1 hypothetical protein [Alistipes sp.]MBR3775928.1 hypothetical protein [Alistipes sp.]